MSVATLSKLAIALDQLETALRLHHERRDTVSVITLAGAAEEILGQLLRERGESNALEDHKKAAVAIHRHLFDEDIGAKVFADRANRARNALKHHTPGEDGNVTCDFDDEAVDMLDRAISNYWQLVHEVTPAMQRFTDEQRAV